MTDEVLTDADLAEIEARVEAATKGPWRAGDGSGETMYHGNYAILCRHKSALRMLLTLNSNFRTEEDSAFIAHARTDVPRLVAEVKRLRAIASDRLT